METNSIHHMSDRVRSIAKSDATLAFHRSLRSVFPHLVLLVFFIILSVWLTERYAFLSSHSPIFGYSFRLPLLIPISLGLAAVLVHYIFDRRYEIGVDYVRSQAGLLSFKKSDMRIMMTDIRGIEIRRGVYGRLVNFGDIEIGSAMHGGAEIFMYGVDDPSFFRDVIVLRRHAAEEEIAAAALRKVAD
jgi:hypothetical protein